MVLIEGSDRNNKALLSATNTNGCKVNLIIFLKILINLQWNKFFIFREGSGIIEK